MISKVISVCSMKDSTVWEISSKNILKYILSEKYIVIVPNGEVDFFKKISPPIYTVVPESEYIGNLKSKIISRMKYGKIDRAGWYLQQFIKLAAIKLSEETDLILIWDADTVPLKNLKFFDNSSVYYYKAFENHHDYFTTAKKILQMNRVDDYSYISQCFPIKGLWAHNFFLHIELTNQKNWIDSMLDNIDFNNDAAFSEYETLGVYLSNKYANDIRFCNKKWLRTGNSVIGGIDNINKFPFKFIIKRYDFISFENWNKKTIPMTTLIARKIFSKIISVFYK